MSRNYYRKLLQKIINENYYRKLSPEIITGNYELVYSITRKMWEYRDTGVSKIVLTIFVNFCQPWLVVFNTQWSKLN